MKEFMTKVSDYISERRNDPEKNGNMMIFCMIGVAILVIVILCLLLLWRKNANVKKQETTMETHEEILEPILAEPPEEALNAMFAESREVEGLRQEYLTNIEYLEQKIEELLNSLMEVKETIEETIIIQMEDDDKLKEQREQIEEMTGDIYELTIYLKNIENSLYDLTDIVNVINAESVPALQEQIRELGEQMSLVKTNLSDIFAKINALDVTDKELKARLSKIEKALKASLEQNLEDILKQIDNMNERTRRLEALLEEARAQIEEAQAQIGNTQTQLEGAQRQIGETQTQLGDAKVQIGETQTQLGDAKVQIGDAQAQIEELRKQLGSAQEQINNMQTQIENTNIWIQNTDSQLLRYRYDEDTNTLSLLPNSEELGE